MNISVNSGLADLCDFNPLDVTDTTYNAHNIHAVLLLEYDNSDEPKGYTTTST